MLYFRKKSYNNNENNKKSGVYMVDPGTVEGDMDNAVRNLNSYSEIVGDLGDGWEGDSYKNFKSQTSDIMDNYKSVIKSQAEAFGNAINRYKEYIEEKSNIEKLEYNIEEAKRTHHEEDIPAIEADLKDHLDNKNRIANEIRSLIASAASSQLDSGSSTGTVSVNASTSQSLGTPSYGSFTNEHYTDKNGVGVDYYLYVPDYGKKVDNLPIHMYLHGSGETGGGVLNCGLPNIISEEQINPSGIVICPQASTTDDFYNSDYQDALVNLTGTVADEYNGDPNRVSISGHSMGAIAGYQLIGRNPGYFSAFVPISGVPSSLDETQNVNVWAFHGAQDDGCDYGTTVDAINTLQENGANASLHTFEDAGHGGVQNYTFQEEYEDSEGNMINPLEWAFEQTKK